MRQVLIRALHLLRWPAVLLAVAAVAGGCSALVVLPLFGIPGYELGSAVALGLGTLGGAVGIAAAFQERRLIQGRDPRPRGAERSDGAMASTLMAVSAAIVVTGFAAVPPFLAAVGYAWSSTRCNPFAQLGFYPLLAAPSALLASAAGVFCGLRARGAVSAALSYVALLLASAVWTAWPLYFGPQVFAFNHFGGYFPGPLYDVALSVRGALVWFRLETVLIATLFWLVTAWCLDMREGRIRWPRVRPGAFALLALIALAVVALEDRAPQLGTRMTAAHLAERLGGLRQTQHFQIVYPKGKPPQEVERLAKDAEFRYHRVADFLGGEPQEPIHLYVYRSAQEKQALVGAAHTQFAKPWRSELHVNDGPFPLGVLEHELVHVMAARYGSGPFKVTSRYGVLPNMGVVEGTAVAGQNPVDELTLHEWAAGMRRQKLAPNLSALFRLSGFYGSAEDRAYTYAGSFIRYLADTYGKQKLQALYARGDFELAYGRTLESLAAEWEGFLDKLPLDAAAVNQAFARFRRGSLFTLQCEREVAELSTEAQEALHTDPQRALHLLERCAALQPDEPAFQMSQVQALEALDRKGEAAAKLAALEGRTRDKPALLAEVLMERADLDVKSDKKAEAQGALHALLALGVSAPMERTAQVKLAALASPRVGDAIWSYFQPGHDDVKLLLLREALGTEPDNAIISYLLGRRLEQGGSPGLAAGYLSKALAGDLPPSIRREALRLQVEANYLAGDCAGVKNEVGHLPDLGLSLKAQAAEWAQRCDFEAASEKQGRAP